MRKVLFLLMTMNALIFSACQKQFEKDTEQNVGNANVIMTSIARNSKINEVFFLSKQEAVNRVNKFNKKADSNVQLDSITNISYVHTPRRTYAFVFYQTPSGPKNLVVVRSYMENGEVESESVSTCGGNQCECKVQAVIDNQGNVTIGCNCSTCVMISTP